MMLEKRVEGQLEELERRGAPFEDLRDFKGVVSQQQQQCKNRLKELDLREECARLGIDLAEFGEIQLGESAQAGVARRKAIQGRLAEARGD